MKSCEGIAIMEGRPTVRPALIVSCQVTSATIPGDATLITGGASVLPGLAATTVQPLYAGGSRIKTIARHVHLIRRNVNVRLVGEASTVTYAKLTWRATPLCRATLTEPVIQAASL